ncbi:MAG TPA: hypothetical protein VFN76_02335 [Candidatus Limnocylindria bacterium]|nr:hypothetical protein [Candidatus Limnocylindria bacterium]
MKGDAWAKSSDAIRARFEAGVAGIEDLEQRQMSFGYPAAFIGGNLTTSLHRESWIVRLPEAERTELTSQGWSEFRADAGPADARLRRHAGRGRDGSAEGTGVGRARG